MTTKAFDTLKKGDRFTFRGRKYLVTYTEQGASGGQWVDFWTLIAIDRGTNRSTEFSVRRQKQA